jgi:hypothetical protein
MPESLCACVRPSGKSLIVRHPQTALTGVHVPQGPKPPPCHGHCKKSRPSQAVATVSVKTRRLVAATNDSNQWKHEARREPVSTCGHQGSPDCPLRANSGRSPSSIVGGGSKPGQNEGGLQRAARKILGAATQDHRERGYQPIGVFCHAAETPRTPDSAFSARCGSVQFGRMK